jgi:Tfp pilus assembly protein PilO
MNRNLIILGAGALILALGFLLVLPKYQALQTLNASVAEKEMELESQENYFSRVSTLYQHLDVYQNTLAKIGTALPEDPSPSSLFSFFQQTASENGLILREINLGGTTEPEEGDKFRTIQAFLELSGSYQAFSVLRESSKYRALLLNRPTRTGTPLFTV